MSDFPVAEVWAHERIIQLIEWAHKHELPSFIAMLDILRELDSAQKAHVCDQRCWVRNPQGLVGMTFISVRVQSDLPEAEQARLRDTIRDMLIMAVEPGVTVEVKPLHWWELG